MLGKILVGVLLYVFVPREDGIRLVRFIGFGLGRSVGMLRTYRQNAEKLMKMNPNGSTGAVSKAKDLDRIAREIRMAVWMARPGALVRMGPSMGMTISPPVTTQSNSSPNETPKTFYAPQTTSSGIGNQILTDGKLNEHVEVSKYDHDGPRQNTCFSVKYHHRTFHFSCLDQNERDTWMNAIGYEKNTAD